MSDTKGTTGKTLMSEGRTSLLGAALSMLGPFSLSLYTPAMPALTAAFGTTDAAIKASLSVFFGGFAFAMLVTGPLADAFGRRRTVVGFLAIYVVGSFLATFADDVPMLLAGRLIQGIGASVGLTVGRAIVRDQFIGEPAARIMNMIGIMLAVGPAIAPTFGGLILHFIGWKAIFFTMIAFGLGLGGLVLLLMPETGHPDPRKARPLPLAKAYWRLLGSPHFMAASLVIAASVGTLYALASILPFVLINIAGLTPSQFGMGMLMQTGLYFSGSVTFRFALRRFTSRAMVGAGLVFIALGATALAISTEVLPISYLSVMLPVGLFAFGIAFVMPYVTNAALLPFPDIAGSASAMMGFMQMGSGLVTGMIAAALGSPVLALQVVVPAMGAIAVICYIWLRFADRLPEEPSDEGGNAAEAGDDWSESTQRPAAMK
ncbi:multidrug effflux MFS transporter [Martelella endophytica]|uniref:Bcr/CflA family efflux transporter n=1 Tax=Martelella endophytica TaxID=1486262 RepID=A0A0D5LN44_MAREN|nr:multidrug effflux MFS transporter [Martelella endophytica]AJY45644.1 multidrug transporter CflA [Martelella endophytica]